MTTLTANKIRSFVRESVREELSATLMEIRASFTPLISKSEATAITKLYKKPTHKVARVVRAAL